MRKQRTRVNFEISPEHKEFLAKLPHGWPSQLIRGFLTRLEAEVESSCTPTQVLYQYLDVKLDDSLKGEEG